MNKIKTLSMLSLVALLTSCTNNAPELLNQKISHETKFGGVYIETTIDDFNNLGFGFGDSLDITFTNGFHLDDLPYYSGYYVDNQMPLLVGYPGYPYIRAGFNNGGDMWEYGELSEADTATIKLHEKGKYLDIQEAMDIHYTDIQGDIPDVVFGNFRACNVGNLKENILYRSASPIDNHHNRAAVVDRLITNKVNTIIDLSDDDDEIIEHINADDFNSPYFKSLNDNGNVIALSMGMNFQSYANNQEEIEVPSLFVDFKNEAFSSKLMTGLRFMASHEAPYLVHCVEGKDRTGFVIMVLEALAGASYEEIIDDYMITYDNYYGINKQDNLSKYNVLKEKNIDVMLKTLVNDESVDIKTANYAVECEEYLLDKGLDSDTIQTLKDKIIK